MGQALSTKNIYGMFTINTIRLNAPATLALLFISIPSFALPHRRNLWHDATGSSTWLKINLPNDALQETLACAPYRIRSMQSIPHPCNTFFTNQREWEISTKVGYGSQGIMTNEAFNVAHRKGIALVIEFILHSNWMWTFFFYPKFELNADCRVGSTLC